MKKAEKDKIYMCKENVFKYKVVKNNDKYDIYIESDRHCCGWELCEEGIKSSSHQRALKIYENRPFLEMLDTNF